MIFSDFKISIFTFFIWCFAIISILILTLDLYIHSPNPLSPLSKSDQIPIVDQKLQNPKNNINGDDKVITYNDYSNCCIATILDESSIKQAITLGYSINSTGGFIPKMYAILDSNISEIELNTLKKYFNIIYSSNDTQSLKFKELLLWRYFQKCSPLVYVTPNGVFNKDPSKICSAKPFSAVSKKGDIVYFDTSLMVIDPQNKVTGNENNEQHFKKFINKVFSEWNPLSTDLSVEDYNNEYIDFWLKYSQPTFIHFDESVYKSALKNEKESSGSQGLYRIILDIVNNAKTAHLDIFN